MNNQNKLGCLNLLLDNNVGAIFTQKKGEGMLKKSFEILLVSKP